MKPHEQQQPTEPTDELLIEDFITWAGPELKAAIEEMKAKGRPHGA